VKTASAKAKGRRAAKELRNSLLFHFSSLAQDDIRVTPSSVTGEDLLLSPKAQEVLPFVFEVKNQERLNIWSAIQQAQGHISDKRAPLVVFTRNRDRMFVACEWNVFLTLLARRDHVHGA